jgi:TMEM175 potassium channel family protein
MDKHRLELFSDGVFVIVLTLLVLDLEPPPHLQSLSAISEVTPGLIVHAGVFYLIGMAWFLHHNMLTRVHHVSRRTLLLNLLALFWITLIPFAGRMIVEDPMASLGIALLVACRGFYALSLLAMRLSAQSFIDEYPELKPLLRRLTWLSLTLAGVQLVAAPLCWVSPWFGYAALLTAIAGPFIRPVADAEQALLAKRRAAEAAANTVQP